MLWLLVWLPLSLAAHEAAHARLAYMSGDTSVEGRLTLNPLKHLEPIGAVAVPLVTLLLSRGVVCLFAAKPVMFEPARCRKPQIARALVGLAGPATNLALGVALAIVFRLLRQVPGLCDIAYWGMLANLSIGLLNILPIPPLDGSHLWLALIPDRFENLMWSLQLGGISLVFAGLFVVPVVSGHDYVGAFMRTTIFAIVDFIAY